MCSKIWQTPSAIHGAARYRRGLVRLMSRVDAGLATLKRLGYQSGQRLLPPVCVICQQSCHSVLCQDCQQQWPVVQQPCLTCGLPVTGADAKAVCGQCLKQAPHCHRIISAYAYQDRLAWLLKQYKFQRNLAAGKALVEQFQAQLVSMFDQSALANISAGQPVTVMPVPLHWRRLAQRGFNQSHELAHAVQRFLQQRGFSVDLQRLERHKANLSQARSNATQRRRNVSNNFRINAVNLSQRYVIIVDDVVTTGSTVNAIARLCQKQKPYWIETWTLARAVSN